MSTQYYIRSRGIVRGPFPPEKLKELARRGQFSRAYHVSLDGVNWAPAAKHPELLPEAKTVKVRKRTSDPEAKEDGYQLTPDGQPGAAGRTPEQPNAGDWQDQTSWYYVDGGSQTGSKSTLYLLPIAAVGLLILALALALGVFWLPTQPFRAERASPDLSVKPRNDTPEIPDDPVGEEESGDEPEALELGASTEEGIESGQPDGAPQTESETETWREEEPKGEPPPPDPFGDLRKQNNRLKLPPTILRDEHKGVLAEPKTNQNPKDLVTLHVECSTHLELKLIPSKSESTSIFPYTLKLDEEAGDRRWEVWSKGQKTALAVQTLKIATFSLHDGSLRFVWENHEAPLRFIFYSLELRAYDQTAICSFELASKTVDAATFDRKEPIYLPIVQDCTLLESDELILDMRLRGTEESEIKRVTFKEPTASIRLPLQDYHDVTNPNASLELAMKWDDRLQQDYHDVTNANASLELAMKWDDRLQQFWIERKLVGNTAALVEPSEKNPDAYLRANNWKRQTILIELTQQAVDEHRRTVKAEYRSFLRTMRRHNIPLPDAWSKLSPTTRRDAVKVGPKERKDRTRVEERAYEIHDLYDSTSLQMAKIYNKHRDMVDEVDAWHETIKKLKEDLSKNARLEYRLFLRVDGREVDLVKTKNFQETPVESKKRE